MSTKHITYFKLLESLKEEKCPICFLIKENTNKLMQNFLYERVNDPGERERIRKALGFCNRHAWQLQRMGNSLGQAIIYNDILKIILEKIAGKENLKKKEGKCIFCEEEKEVEEMYISVFWKSFPEPEFISRFENSFGLCLPHFYLAIKKTKNLKNITVLVSIEKENLAKLNKDLEEFIRKYDWRFSKEELGKERNAWIKVIKKIAGEEGINVEL